MNASMQHGNRHLKYIFNTAGLSDIPKLLSLENEAFDEKTYGAGYRESASDFREYILSSEYELIIAEDAQSKLSGYILLDVAQDNPSAAHIDSIACFKTARSFTLTRGLLQSAFKAAKAHGFDAVTFEMSENNPAIKTLLNKKIQKRLGLSITGQEDDYYNDGSRAIEFCFKSL